MKKSKIDRVDDSRRDDGRNVVLSIFLNVTPHPPAEDH